MNWHCLSIEQVYSATQSRKEGLTTSQAEECLQKFGRNEIQEGKKKSPFGILLSQFKDFMILILLTAAIVSGIVGDLKDTIVILVIVILNAVVGFIQEYRAEKAMQALKQMTTMNAKTLRNSKITWLPTPLLVPGDIIYLEAGDSIPADIRISESINLKIEEAALTGESIAAEKIATPLETEKLAPGDKKNMAFKGTYVAYGRGTGIVVATGMQTELGKIARLLQEKESLTPLQLRLASFGKKLSIIVGCICVVFFVTGWMRGEDPLKMVLTSISLAVAAIPEALPAVITISLALAAKRLVQYKTLIRKLPAVETLGSVTFICTDKTGTLTKNKMYVEEVFCSGKIYERDKLPSNHKQGTEVDMLLHAFAFNNDVINDDQGKVKGDSTEIALMEVATENSISNQSLPRLAELAFDSGRKLMTTFHSYNGRIISFTKGAPDVILDRCTNADKQEMYHRVDAMAANGYRVLGFAYRFWDSLPQHPDVAKHESGLQFLGLAGIIDPPREEVFDAIQQCRSAGIVPVMITGDHPITAKTIAERIGIIGEPGDMVLTGQQLSELSDDAFESQVEKTKVYARVSPEQKLQIVKMLQKNGHFVAMTGDGVNDAPSLKKANIGIAMGITGTDVSKEAAHMILLDDNFSTIVRAVKEGRRIYDNILEFIKFLMTTNSSEILTLLVGPLIGLPVALLPIHILWINLVSDGLPAISLSFERAERNVMNRPPRPPQQSIFSGGRGVHMIWVGSLMAAIALSLQAWSIENGMHWQTMVFNFMCLAQFAHVLAIRSGNDSFFSVPLLSNKILVFGIIFSLGLQAAITFVPFFQPIFQTEALSASEFMIVGVLASLIFFAIEIEKWIARSRGNRKLLNVAL